MLMYIGFVRVMLRDISLVKLQLFSVAGQHKQFSGGIAAHWNQIKTKGVLRHQELNGMKIP